MALRVDSCAVLLVVMSGFMLIQMEDAIVMNSTISLNNTNSTSQNMNGTTSSGFTSPTSVKNGTNQNPNGASFPGSTNGTNNNTSSSLNNSSTNQNAKDATVSTSVGSSSSSSMTSCFKLLLLVFTALYFLHMIQ